MSVEQELRLAIQTSTCEPVKTSGISTSQELMKIIRQEMTLFENGGTRSRYLQLAYDYTLCLKKTKQKCICQDFVKIQPNLINFCS